MQKGSPPQSTISLSSQCSNTPTASNLKRSTNAHCEQNTFASDHPKGPCRNTSCTRVILTPDRCHLPPAQSTVSLPTQLDDKPKSVNPEPSTNVHREQHPCAANLAEAPCHATSFKSSAGIQDSCQATILYHYQPGKSPDSTVLHSTCHSLADQSTQCEGDVLSTQCSTDEYQPNYKVPTRVTGQSTQNGMIENFHSVGDSHQTHPSLQTHLKQSKTKKSAERTQHDLRYLLLAFLAGICLMSLQIMTKHTPHYQTLSVPHSIILFGMVQLPTLIWFYHAIILPWCQVRHKHSAQRLSCCLHESSKRVKIQAQLARWHQLIGPQATIIHLLSKEHETRAAIQREANTSLSEVRHHFQFSLASYVKLRTNRETWIEYVCSHGFHMYDP